MHTKTAVEHTHPSNSGLGWRMWWRFAIYLSIYALTVLLASLLWHRPTTLTLAYALVILVLLWRSHSRSDLAHFCLAAILGPVGEFVAVGFGAWEYSLPLVRIPIWLPLAYGIVGLGLGKVVALFMQIQLRSGSSNLTEPLRRAARPTHSTAGRCGDLIPNRQTALTCWPD